MNIMLRVLMGTGLFVFGYYLGRGVSQNMATADQARDSHTGRSRVRGRKSDVGTDG